MRPQVKIQLPLLAGLALALNASAQDNIEGAAVMASVETNGIRFMAYATNTSFTAGSPIVMTTVVKNMSTNNVRLSRTGTLYPYIVQVSRQGQEINMTEDGQQIKGNVLSDSLPILEHDEQMIETLNLSKYYDLTNTGDYEFVFSRYVGRSFIIAPPLKIKVVAAN